jgi:hypothetical protein
MYAYVTVSQKNIKIMSKYIDKYNNNIVIDINNNLYKAKHNVIMYHITSKKNAINILKNGFDVSLSKRGAFGLGINLTTDINHLKHYYTNKTNYIVICMVKYNKRQKNSSGPEIIKENGEIKSSKLKDIIVDWAKNDYDAGINYKTIDLPVKRLLLSFDSNMSVLTIRNSPQAQPFFPSK